MNEAPENRKANSFELLAEVAPWFDRPREGERGRERARAGEIRFEKLYYSRRANSAEEFCVARARRREQVVATVRVGEIRKIEGLL